MMPVECSTGSRPPCGEFWKKSSRFSMSKLSFCPNLCLRGVPSCQISRQRLCFQHRSYLGAANPLAKLGRDRSMTTETQGTNVVRVALSAAFRHRQNVIGIPQTFSHLCLETPVEHKRLACGAACPFQPAM